MIAAGSIDVPTSDSINSVTKELTVAAWFRVDKASDTGIRRPNAFLLEEQSSSEPVPDGFAFRLWTTSGLSPGIYGKTKLELGDWYHVAGTWDGTTVKIYKNGVKGGTDGASAAIDASALPLMLGQFNNAIYKHKGQLDDCRVYSAALSVDELEYMFGEVNEAGNRITWGGVETAGGVAPQAAFLKMKHRG